MSRFNDNIENIEEGFRYNTARCIVQTLIQGKDVETIDAKATTEKAVEITDCLIEALKSSAEKRIEIERAKKEAALEQQWEMMAKAAKEEKDKTIEALKETNPIVGKDRNHLEWVEIVEYTGMSKNIEKGQVFQAWSSYLREGVISIHLLYGWGGKKGKQKIFANASSTFCKWRRASI